MSFCGRHLWREDEVCLYARFSENGRGIRGPVREAEAIYDNLICPDLGYKQNGAVGAEETV